MSVDHRPLFEVDVLQVTPTNQGKSEETHEVLIADIGGSTSRFALARCGERPRQRVIVSNATVSTLEAAISQYLDRVGIRPAAAVLAVAGPVNGDEVALTNRSWRFRVSDLSTRFGFRTCKVVNDFAALAWALPRLDGGDVRTIGPVLMPDGGVKIALGPGTGLGVAALVPNERGWQALPSEGGHMSFGPGPADEQPIFAWLSEQFGPLSAEMVLSGPGLHRLYRAVNGGAALADSETIVAMAKAGDAAARSTAALFLRLLARFAGGLALTFKATGGVYIAGGVAHALADVVDDAEFRKAFEAHRPHQALLAKIPTALVTCKEPGLLGCAALAEQLIGADFAI
jgi:glucokinase